MTLAVRPSCTQKLTASHWCIVGSTPAMAIRKVGPEVLRKEQQVPIVASKGMQDETADTGKQECTTGTVRQREHADR